MGYYIFPRSCEDRNQKVESVLSEGQEITVFVAGMDRQGRVKLEWPDKPKSGDNKACAPEAHKEEQKTMPSDEEE